MCYHVPGYVCTCVRVCESVHVCKCACMLTRTHPHPHTHTHTHPHTHTHTHVRMQVTRAEGIEFARSRGMLFIECSAKAKTGIQQVTSFDYVSYLQRRVRVRV